MFTGAVAFDVSIADPKERIQAYIDQWKTATEYNVRSQSTNSKKTARSNK